MTTPIDDLQTAISSGPPMSAAQQAIAAAVLYLAAQVQALQPAQPS